MEQLGHALESRGRALLILDNFEHLVHLAEDTVGRWLTQAETRWFCHLPCGAESGEKPV